MSDSDRFFRGIVVAVALGLCAWATLIYSAIRFFKGG